jgi:hypothetical protein
MDRMKEEIYEENGQEESFIRPLLSYIISLDKNKLRWGSFPKVRSIG